MLVRPSILAGQQVALCHRTSPSPCEVQMLQDVAAAVGSH